MMHDGKIYFLGTPDDLAKTKDHVIRNFVDRNSYHDVEIEDELERLNKKQG
jgi:phospholipid/cholesterol/gamma-HCH transport system ATP-binding protein